jgi:hypothetical protein
MSTVFFWYSGTIIGYIIAILIARALAKKRSIPRSPKFTSRRVNLLFLVGTGALFVAGIVRLGQRTYDGKSTPEILDQVFFWILSIGGIFCLLLDFFIDYYSNNKK